MVTFCTRVEHYFSWVGGFVNVVVQMAGVPRGHSPWLLIRVEVHYAWDTLFTKTNNANRSMF